MVEEKEEAARLLAEEKTKREISAVIEQLKMDFSAVTLKAAEEVGTLALSLEAVVK